MENNLIDISKLDKATVLAALYNSSKQQGMGFMHPRGAKPMTVEEAKEEVKRNPQGYYDYLRGRVMKVDISKDKLDPYLYDRDNGSGAAKRALVSL